MAVKHVLLVAASAVLFAGCARVGEQYTARITARQQAYAAAAGAPVQKFHYFSLWSWEPLSEYQLAVYTHPNEAWLLDLDGRCHNLEFTNHIGLTSSVSEVSAKFDRVLTGPADQPCFIKEIRPVDVAKLNAPQQGKPREVEEVPRPAK